MGRKDKIYNIMDAPFSISGQAAMEHLRGGEGGGAQHEFVGGGCAVFNIDKN